jgi:hypothetical protein
LKTLSQSGVIAVSNVTIGVKGDISDKIKNIKICIGDTIDENWELTGIRLSIKAYSDS